MSTGSWVRPNEEKWGLRLDRKRSQARGALKKSLGVI